MKAALDKEGLKPYLMMQPVGYYTSDSGSSGFLGLPETPFGEFHRPPSQLIQLPSPLDVRLTTGLTVISPATLAWSRSHALAPFSPCLMSFV